MEIAFKRLGQVAQDRSSGGQWIQLPAHFDLRQTDEPATKDTKECRVFGESTMPNSCGAKRIARAGPPLRLIPRSRPVHGASQQMQLDVTFCGEPPLVTKCLCVLWICVDVD